MKIKQKVPPAVPGISRGTANGKKQTADSPSMEDRERVCRVIDAYLSIFGNRWNLLILNELFNGPKRFNELKRSLSPVTQTVLTRHLKALEDWDVIERKVIDGSPPSVYYAISKEGFSVIPSMISSYNWIIQHVPDLKEE